MERHGRPFPLSTQIEQMVLLQEKEAQLQEYMQGAFFIHLLHLRWVTLKNTMVHHGQQLTI